MIQSALFVPASSRSLNLEKGHLTIPKRSQRIARWTNHQGFFRGLTPPLAGETTRGFFHALRTADFSTSVVNQSTFPKWGSYGWDTDLMYICVYIYICIQKTDIWYNICIYIYIHTDSYIYTHDMYMYIYLNVYISILPTIDGWRVTAWIQWVFKMDVFLLGCIEPFVKDFVQQWVDGKMGYITTWRIIPVTGRKWFHNHG